MAGNCCDSDGDLWKGDGLPRRCAPRNDSAAALLGRTESSAPTSCHSEPVLTLAWESVSPRLPLRGRCQREALTEGEMPRVFLSPSRLRRQPPPRGGLTAQRRRAAAQRPIANTGGKKCQIRHFAQISRRMLADVPKFRKLREITCKQHAAVVHLHYTS